MTDNEIIKAWENEIHLAEYVDSDYCSNVEVSLIKETINTFNRQKAENEDLKAKNNTLTHDNIACYDEVLKLKAEIERLRGNNKALRLALDLYKGWEEKAKAEAVKEFAERLKKKSIGNYDWNKKDWCWSVKVEDIDNLLKEMVGEE